MVPGSLVVEDVVLLQLHEEVGPRMTAATLLHALGGAVLVDLALLGQGRNGRPRRDGGDPGRVGVVVALGPGSAPAVGGGTGAGVVAAAVRVTAAVRTTTRAS